jgi:hypothetical protein
VLASCGVSRLAYVIRLHILSVQLVLALQRLQTSFHVRLMRSKSGDTELTSAADMHTTPFGLGPGFGASL